MKKKQQQRSFQAVNKLQTVGKQRQMAGLTPINCCRNSS